MRKTFLLVVLIFLAAAAYKFKDDSMSAQVVAAVPIQTEDPRAESKASQVKQVDDTKQQLKSITDSIQKLENELADLDHELDMIGYPQVMLDERVSESEKAQIVDKVLTASTLQNKISQLSIRKIDLQAETNP